VVELRGKKKDDREGPLKKETYVSGPSIPPLYSPALTGAVRTPITD